MSLVSVENLAIAFGKKVVLDGESFAVQPGDKIGLVGPNGTGKSTLLRILAGEREADAGQVFYARGVRAGYLPQDILELPPGTLVESVRAAVPGNKKHGHRHTKNKKNQAATNNDETRSE